MTCLVICTVCRCRKWGPRIVRDQFQKLEITMQESEIPKNYKKLAKNHEHMQLLDWHLLLKKVPTYSFLMRKTSCFPNEILKNRSLCTRAPPPPEPCLWEWIYKTIQFRTMMSVRKSLFFPFFSHFSLFVFFIQSEKVNVAALQFCNCLHIHSKQ